MLLPAHPHHHIKQILQVSKGQRIWIIVRFKKKVFRVVKKRRQRKGWGADGNRRKDGATEERKGAMARSCNDRPPDYFVAQINWPFAGSLESSCKWWDRGLLAYPRCFLTFPHLHQQVSEEGNGVTAHLRGSLIACHFLHLQTCLERLSLCALIIVNLRGLKWGAAWVEKRRERMVDVCLLMEVIMSHLYKVR